MRLKKGDILVCIMKDIDDLTYGKSYDVVNTQKQFSTKKDDIICIKDDRNLNWWFGQVGESEDWAMWFVTEQQWIRQQKLNQLI